MNKKIKGYELFKMMAEKKLKTGVKLINDDEEIWEFDGRDLVRILGDNPVTDIAFVEKEFVILDLETLGEKILEDEEETDIQGIDIIRDYRTSDDDLYNDNFGDFKSTINELVKAVKQLDKKINKED